MKRWLSRIKTTFTGRRSTALCLVLAGLMFAVVNAPAAITAAAPARQLPIYCVQRDQKVVSISFDAAWGDVIVRQ